MNQTCSPKITAQSIEDGVVSLLKETSLFIGEEHGNTASATLLQRISQEARKNNTKYLFLEQFDQSNQHILDEFAQNGNRKILLAYLENNGWAKGDTPKQKLEYMDALIDTVDAYQKAGIKVMGIDDPALSAPDQRPKVNSSWEKYIRSVVNPDDKYIILAGNGHSADYSHNKGVDALLGIPSVDLNDRRSILSPDPNQELNTLKCNPHQKSSTYLMSPT